MNASPRARLADTRVRIIRISENSGRCLDYSIEKESSNEVVVHMQRPAIISPILVERWVTLRDGVGILENRHRVTNVGTERVDFLWGTHPGISVSQTSRIDIPESEVLIDESSPDSRLGERGMVYTWPYEVSRRTAGRHEDCRDRAKRDHRHALRDQVEGGMAVGDGDGQRDGDWAGFPHFGLQSHLALACLWRLEGVFTVQPSRHGLVIRAPSIKRWKRESIRLWRQALPSSARPRW